MSFSVNGCSGLLAFSGSGARDCPTIRAGRSPRRRDLPAAAPFSVATATIADSGRHRSSARLCLSVDDRRWPLYRTGPVKPASPTSRQAALDGDRRRANRDPSGPAPVKIPAAPGVFVGSRHTGRGRAGGQTFSCIHVSRRSGPTRPDLHLVSVLRPALCAGAPEAPAAVQQVWGQQPRR